MICQHCGQRHAQVHVTKMINGVKAEMHWCETCAMEKGELPQMGIGFSLHQLLSGFLEHDSENATVKNTGKHEPRSKKTMLRCASCGMNYAQFSKVGRLGCAACYTHFGERLKPMLKRVQGGMVHVGKLPKRGTERVQLKRRIEQLKLQLLQLIANEEFEQAATLRDQIRILERGLSEHE